MNQGTYANDNFAIKNKYENQYYLKTAIPTNSNSLNNNKPTSITSGTSTTSTILNKQSLNTDKKQFPMDILNGLLGRDSTAYDEKWLHGWQYQWLSILGMTGEGVDITKAVTVTGPKPIKSTQITDTTTNNNEDENDDDSNTGMNTSPVSLNQIDGKLFAVLRILYSKSENDILQHGYTPFTLQDVNSMLSVNNEIQVIKTMVGILSVILFQYDTQLYDDVLILHDPDYQPSTTSTSTSKTGSDNYHSRDIISQIQTYLRSLLYPSVDNLTNNNQLLLNSLQKMKLNINQVLNDFDNRDNSYINNKLHNNDDDEDNSNNDEKWRNVEDENETVDNNRDNTFRYKNSSTNNNNNNRSKNMQEILKYRIRKKSMIVDLIGLLITHYTRLIEYSLNSTDNSNNKPATSSLLTNENKTERKAKIKDLLNEVTCMSTVY